MQIIRFLLALAVGLTLAMVPSTSHAATAFTFDVGTANIKNNLTRSQIENDVNKVVGTSSVVGWQEMKTFDHNDVLDDLVGWDHVGLHSGRYQPISWDASKWTLINDGWETINSNQNRWLTWVVLERIGAAGDPGVGQRIRFVNTHFTSGMNWESTNPTQAELDARAQWNDCWNSMNNRIDTWRSGGGYPIVGLGDYNKKRDDIALFDSAQAHYSIYNKIDHVFVIPKSRFENKGEDTAAGPYYTDHGPYVAKVRFLG